MMDIVRALEILKKLELRVRDLYEFYHRFFSADREAAAVFLELSTEEKSHADLIDYEVRMIRKNRSIFNDVEFDPGPLIGMIARIETLISSEGPGSLGEALKFAMELEDDPLEDHFRTLIAKSNPEVRELILKLGISDSEHFDKLTALAGARGLPA